MHIDTPLPAGPSVLSPSLSAVLPSPPPSLLPPSSAGPPVPGALQCCGWPSPVAVGRSSSEHRWSSGELGLGAVPACGGSVCVACV